MPPHNAFCNVSREALRGRLESVISSSSRCYIANEECNVQSKRGCRQILRGMKCHVGPSASLCAVRVERRRADSTNEGMVVSKAACKKGPESFRHPSADSSGRARLLELSAAIAVLLPGAAHAGEMAPDGFLDNLFRAVDQLGPLGPLAFTLVVTLCECIPLFPTQPLSLASGLLFGTSRGAICMLGGTTLAALIAFVISRGVGRPLAERIIRREMSESSPSTSDASSNVGPVQSKFIEVQEAIERGSFMQQASAILVLRLTPIVPFSASNYVLGLSPLPVVPYLVGTMAGMAFWSTLYASLGGASRALLTRGADPDALLGDLLHKAGNITSKAGILVAIVGGIGTLSYLAMNSGRLLDDDSDAPSTGTMPSDSSDSNGTVRPTGTETLAESTSKD